MQILNKPAVLSWASESGIKYNQDTGRFSFQADDYVFRIPIGDYVLQLDYRIKAAFELLPESSDLLGTRIGCLWKEHVFPTTFDAILRAMEIIPKEGTFEGALLFTPEERLLILGLSYLTNRWGRTREGLYVMPDGLADLLLYFPGADTASLFVMTRDREVHDRCVETLREQEVPAYGPSVENPLPLPRYKPFKAITDYIPVDPDTGKPNGKGSEESVLLPEFLPPSR